MTANDTTIAALLEQLIADGPQAMAQVMTTLMNVAMKLEREQFGLAPVSWRAEVLGLGYSV